MMKRIFLAGIAALVSWTGCVHAQADLGTPTTRSQPPQSDGQVVLLPPLDRICPAPMAPACETCNLLPTCVVPAVSREDVQRMIVDGHYSPAEITAAKIKLDESHAQVRRAAVRYLAGVNCHHYPEAECGLIAALRADRNECVRLEAALAMGTCDCLTPKVAAALQVALSGCETDGNPAEISERVRSAARQALSRYHAHGIGLSPQMLPPSDWTPPTPGPMPMPIPITITPLSAFAPPTLAELQRAESVGLQRPTTGTATGQRTLYHLIVSAMGIRESAPVVPNVTPAGRRVPTSRPLGLTPLGSQVNLAIPNE